MLACCAYGVAVQGDVFLCREAAIFDDACTVPTPCLLLPVITYSAFILDENYHALSIIPQVIDSATIVAQQSIRRYFDLSSEH